MPQETEISSDGRRRDAKSGRIQPSTSPAELEEVLREIGAPSGLQEIKEKLGVTDPRAVKKHLMAGAGSPNSPIHARKSGGKKNTTWIFWLEEPAGEEEGEEEEEDPGEHYNEYADGMQLICNVCGHKFKPGEVCHSIDRMVMVDTEEGKINGILQVCEKCMPRKLKKASWDLV